MEDDTNKLPNTGLDDNNQDAVNQPLPEPSSRKVIQPSPELVQELKAQQQPAQPAVIAPQNPQPVASQAPSVPQGHMQPGMSASQLGLNQSQHSIHWKSFTKPVLTVVILLVIAGAGVLLYKNLTGYGTKTVQGAGFSYTVTYSRAASQVSVNGHSYLQGSDKTGQSMLLYVGKSVRSQYDCYAGSGGAQVIAKPEIDGTQHNLCYSPALNAYAMNFTHNGAWYFLTIFPKDKSQTLDQDTVKMIASSLKLSS